VETIAYCTNLWTGDTISCANLKLDGRKMYDEVIAAANAFVMEVQSCSSSVHLPPALVPIKACGDIVA